MISDDELSSIFLFVRTLADPEELFVIPHVVLTSPEDVNLKWGMENLLVDFPRISYEILSKFIFNYCSDKFKEVSDINSAIESILNDKENPENPLWHASSVLTSMGVEWWIDTDPQKEVPVLKIDATEYYRNYWEVKIKDFVERLNNGEDYPTTIYYRASVLASQSSFSLIFPEQIDIGFPGIFKLLLALDSLNIFTELESIKHDIRKLKNIITVPGAYPRQIWMKGVIESAFSDIAAIIDQISLLFEHGHFAPGYPLLRKSLMDLGMILFFWSFSKEYPNIAEELGEDPLLEEQKLSALEDSLNECKNRFLSEWLRVYYDDVERPLVAPVYVETVEDIAKTLKIGNFNNLKDEHSKRRVFVELYSTRKVVKNNKEFYAIEFGDTLYIEAIDVLLNTERLVFDAIKAGVNFPHHKEKLQNPKLHRAYFEYHKLSDGVHSPVLVDFPPYSSTIEYLGFLHHLKIVRGIFSDVVRKINKISADGPTGR